MSPRPGWREGENRLFLVGDEGKRTAGVQIRDRGPVNSPSFFRIGRRASRRGVLPPNMKVPIRSAGLLYVVVGRCDRQPRDRAEEGKRVRLDSYL